MMKNIYVTILKLITREKLLNSEKNIGRVFDASELTIDEMKALMA